MGLGRFAPVVFAKRIEIKQLGQEPGRMAEETYTESIPDLVAPLQYVVRNLLRFPPRRVESDRLDTGHRARCGIFSEESSQPIHVVLHETGADVRRRRLG